MKVSTNSGMALVIAALLLSASTFTGSATPAQGTASLAQRDVIVVLRDQRADLPPARGARAVRAAALAAAQTPIVSHLQSSGATRIHGFALINAVAATLSTAEAEALSSHPLVKAVVPVMTLKARRPASISPPRIRSSGAGVPVSSGASSALCNTLEPEALQLTHSAFLDSKVPQAQHVRDGNGEFVTGKGVKVAWIADGLDPALPGFVRPDGSSVFIDYQDFSGDPAGTPTGGGEAFGDASSIAAQDTPNGKPLTFDISQFVNPARALPSPCNIRIRGMAPGASLVGLKVFSQLGITTNAAIVQAIEYAVIHDDVDVINESFDFDDFPDNEDDVISLADEQAVRGGVTVVVSTGDAGTNGTMGAPSTDAAVISVGATTQFRLYAQTGDGTASFGKGGWISDNISSFSSGGFSMSGPRTPDVVAPGDQGWALCSTNIAIYLDCSSAVQNFAGTSESAPLVAGAVSLVIQAYRSTHHGANPSAVLVRRIIMSTAKDLGAPSSEQGAGLVNALKAVEAALSIADENGKPTATGTSLLGNPSRATVVDFPTKPETLSFSITNLGTATEHLKPTLQALGPPIAHQKLTLTLNPTAGPTYITQTFDVPAGAEHLDAAVAYRAPFNGRSVLVYLGLIDPEGRDAAYSFPQASTTGYGHVDIVHPAPGTWTAIIWTYPPNEGLSYSGPVQFTWAAENYVTFGSVAPSRVDLVPGATQYITARFLMPEQPGDEDVAIRFAPSSGAALSEIPIALRTLIPIGPGGGSFAGRLSGGNGASTTGPTQTYAFDVPRGINSMSLSLQIPDDGYLLEGLLVDPNGMQLSVEPNFDANGNPAFSMQLDRAHPQPGRWRFVLLVDYYTSGKEISIPFMAQIGFKTSEFTATGLPNNPNIKLSASGPPVVVPIEITNNAGLAEAYFADARLD